MTSLKTILNFTWIEQVGLYIPETIPPICLYFKVTDVQHSLFEISETTLLQQVFIPGDNDAGGEGVDPRQDWKVKRFHKFFTADNPDVETVKFVDFIKV